MSDREILDRWSLNGGDWAVAELDESKAVVDLCTCTGEVLERLESSEPALIEFLRAEATGFAGDGGSASDPTECAPD